MGLDGRFFAFFSICSDSSFWIIHATIFSVNILLLCFSKQITGFLNRGLDIKTKVTMFRSLNIIFLIFHVVDILLGKTNVVYNNFFFKLGWTIVTLYMAILGYNVLCYFSRRKFGFPKMLDGIQIRIDSYNSRLIDLFLMISIIFVVFYIFINIWNWDSMLETTGLFGVLIGFLALTNQTWAPDIYFGMVILNSQLLEDGDVIQLNDGETEYIINKVNFIYTVLLDVRNNHRTFLRNSNLINHRIDNLSKKASADGVRHKLIYKIGYPPFLKEKDQTKREEMFNYFIKKIDSMFNQVYSEICKKDDVIQVNALYPFEWSLTDTGNYALEYTLYYSLDALPNTKVTKTIRQFLVGSRNAVNEEVYKQSVICGIDLSTPMIVETNHAKVNTFKG